MKILEKTSEHTTYECPYCKSGKIKINHSSVHKYADCDTCGATYIDYIPLPHQMDVHKSHATFKLLIGG